MDSLVGGSKRAGYKRFLYAVKLLLVSYRIVVNEEKQFKIQIKMCYLLEVYLKPLGMHCATLIFLKRGFYDRAEGNEENKIKKKLLEIK